MKGDPMDLRLDIERRKKYSTHDREYDQDRGRDMGDSPDCSRERSVEKFSKCRERSKYVQLRCTCFKLPTNVFDAVVYLPCVINSWP